MLSATCRYKLPHKDRSSALLLLKDKSKVFSEDNKLKESFTPLGLPTNPIDQEPSPSINPVLKYFKQKPLADLANGLSRTKT